MHETYSELHAGRDINKCANDLRLPIKRRDAVGSTRVVNHAHCGVEPCGYNQWAS